MSKKNENIKVSVITKIMTMEPRAKKLLKIIGGTIVLQIIILIINMYLINNSVLGESATATLSYFIDIAFSIGVIVEFFNILLYIQQSRKDKKEKNSKDKNKKSKKAKK